MFTWRYHIVSLAAVFVALAVGILLGVAISGNLSEAQTSFERSEIARLNEELANQRSFVDAVGRSEAATSELLEEAYPALMDGRLAGRGFAVLFLGPVDGSVRSAVERTLADSGSGAPVRLIAIDTPVDAREVDDELLNHEELAVYAEDGDDFGDLGEALARELVGGGETPLWTALSNELVEERSGSSAPAVEGAIIARSWVPPEDAEGDELRPTETLFEGLLDGLGAAPVPAIGVETTTGPESSIELYRRQGVSSVDNVDTLAGRLALALLLGGGQPGHYGIKDSASDGVAPPIESVPEEE
jgi:hypothetical protein